MESPRHSQAVEAELISDPLEKARREASNGLEQAAQVQILIGQHVLDGRPFKLRPSTIMQLHRAALSGISAYAGVYRPAGIEIGKSEHEPPGAHLVPELVEDLCEYVNDRFEKASPIHLASYVMWRVNWIHPFTDGNGRTARAASYLVLSVSLRMILPGPRTIPEQIISNRQPYYNALEKADRADAQGQVDVSGLEALMSNMLAAQLVSVVETASGAKVHSY